MARETALTAPRVSDPDLPGSLVPGHAARAVDLVAARVELVGDVDAAHASLEQCVLHIDAGALDLTGATVLDVDAADAKAVSVVLRDARIRRLRIRGGRIGTLDLRSARIDELELADLRIEYLNLAGATATDVLVRDSTIRTLDTPQARLTRVAFEDCRSDEVDPRGMTAKDVDLRGLDSLAYTDTNALRGTTLSGFQVQQLAETLASSAGILIHD